MEAGTTFSLQTVGRAEGCGLAQFLELTLLIRFARPEPLESAHLRLGPLEEVQPVSRDGKRNLAAC